MSGYEQKAELAGSFAQCLLLAMSRLKPLRTDDNNLAHHDTGGRSRPRHQFPMLALKVMIPMRDQPSRYQQAPLDGFVQILLLRSTLSRFETVFVMRRLISALTAALFSGKAPQAAKTSRRSTGLA